MTTRDQTLPPEYQIARAVLEASLQSSQQPYAHHEPAQVTELYHLRSTDPAEPTRFVLAAGHDTEAVVALASGAPHFDRGTPDAVVIELPGSTMANPDADPNNPESIVDSAHALPVRGARVVVVTANGIGGAMVAELANGPSPIAAGPHDPDSPDPLITHATALWLARQTSDHDRRTIMEAIDNHLQHGADLDSATEILNAVRPPDPRPHWRTIYNERTQ